MAPPSPPQIGHLSTPACRPRNFSARLTIIPATSDESHAVYFVESATRALYLIDAAQLVVSYSAGTLSHRFHAIDTEPMYM